MKAIVLRELGGPDKLLYEDAPDPQANAGEVVVKLKAAALNHRAPQDPFLPAHGQPGARSPPNTRVAAAVRSSTQRALAVHQSTRRQLR